VNFEKPSSSLVKRGDARSGLTSLVLIPILKPKHTSQNHSHCHVERKRNISDPRRKNVFYCNAL